MISGYEGYVDMPVMLRMTTDLESPAIDNKKMFLLDKNKVDDIRRAAILELKRREKRGDYRGSINEFAPFAGLVERGLIGLAKSDGAR